MSQIWMSDEHITEMKEYLSKINLEVGEINRKLTDHIQRIAITETTVHHLNETAKRHEGDIKDIKSDHHDMRYQQSKTTVNQGWIERGLLWIFGSGGFIAGILAWFKSGGGGS